MFKKYLAFVSGWNGLVTFTFLILVIGQLISFLNAELMGFLFVTFYFGVFPIVAIFLLITNIILIATQEPSNRSAAMTFSGLLLAYLLVLWRFPLVGSFAFFMSDYSKVAPLSRCVILLITGGLWFISNRQICKKLPIEPVA
ncbi:MAG: hypothetical protein IT289_00025 [Oligoflexia bacterium]|nr:hypothetical protein [Oligoflexia bacterium]